ncbi:urease accessory protein UreE-like [Chelonus insularis]|uniref:urease accessory protein UreE-like n=1 Tax=Chelonus insularis TaxID=460826 RepID=UPI00158E9540|nr:urease accessory protein UreE-like [Chelonus insularis]
MAKLIFLIVLAFAAYVAAYPSQDSMQSLPGRVKRAPGPSPNPGHVHHYETETRDRFGNTFYRHEDVYHHDRNDFFGHGHYGHDHFGHDHFGHGYHGHGHHGHGLLGGFFDIFG